MNGIGRCFPCTFEDWTHKIALNLVLVSQKKKLEEILLPAHFHMGRGHLELDSEAVFMLLEGIGLLFDVLGKFHYGIRYGCASPWLVFFLACSCHHVSEKSFSAAEVSGRAFLVCSCLPSLVLWLPYVLLLRASPSTLRDTQVQLIHLEMCSQAYPQYQDKCVTGIHPLSIMSGINLYSV